MKAFSLYKQWLRHQQIAFDTSFLIPLLEDATQKEGIVTRIFEIAERRSILLLTSTVTLLEVLVHPYRRKAIDTVNLYYGYLVQAPYVQLIALSAEIADCAARLRAEYGFKTPDAIQLSTAITKGATLFLTRDREFRRQREIEIGLI